MIADQWLKSPRLSALKDFIAKTRGRLILLEAVEIEFRGHVIRNFESHLEAIVASTKSATRMGIANLPEIDSTAIVTKTVVDWEETFARFFRGYYVSRVKAESSILSELMHRAALRMAPVTPNGREMRDAIIWLSMLAYLRSRKSPEMAAFVSNNIRDVAGPDRVSLRADLANEVATIRGAFEYYPSLESFIRTHAKPVQHIDKAWVLKRLDMTAVREKISRRLESEDAERLIRLSSNELHESYAPRRINSSESIECTLEDVYVYEVEQRTINIFLDFSVIGEVEVEAMLVRRLPRDWDDEYRPEYPVHRTFSTEVEISVSMDAIVAGELLLLGDVEELARA